MTLDELIAKQPPEIAAAIERVIEEAGTSDADWSVLLTAGKLIAYTPLSEAQEAVREAQLSTHDCAPLEFGDRRPTVRVLMTTAGWLALRRALGMEDDGK